MTMAVNPLSSLVNYSRFVVELCDRSQRVRSTVRIWSDSPYTGIAEGEVVFPRGIVLRLREELDFDAARIVSYGYEVYQHGEKLYWYDDFPHPTDASLAATFPHHKHVPPDIKRHRILAPGLSFVRPNLPLLIREIEDLINGQVAESKVGAS
jgi:hypothetical protein